MKNLNKDNVLGQSFTGGGRTRAFDRNGYLTRLLVICALGLAILLPASPARAIVGGGLDGTNHPNVVALFLTYDGVTWVAGSGTLVAPRVIITVAHGFVDMGAGRPVQQLFYSFTPIATGVPLHHPSVPFDWSNFQALESQGILKSVDLSDPINDQRIFIHPNWHGLPTPGGIGSNSWSQTKYDDLAVVVLDSPPEPHIDPAQIAPLNYMDKFKAGTLLTLVGYGVNSVVADPTTPQGADNPAGYALVYDAVRRSTTAPLQHVNQDVIVSSGNLRDARGGGGTCYGDSGGPAFLGDYVVGVDVWIGPGYFGCIGSNTVGHTRLDDADARCFWQPLLNQYGDGWNSGQVPPNCP